MVVHIDFDFYFGCSEHVKNVLSIVKIIPHFLSFLVVLQIWQKGKVLRNLSKVWHGGRGTFLQLSDRKGECYG